MSCVLKVLLGSAYCFVISTMTSLILWYQLDESFILALRRPAVPLPQPDTVMVSDCCNCSALSSCTSANQLAPSSWMCHIALMGHLGTDPQAPRCRDLIQVCSLILMWNFFQMNANLRMTLTERSFWCQHCQTSLGLKRIGIILMLLMQI